ncbi:large subunit GTPase 1 [Clonorchis sinensis]|uniref:Large subunit GTPase 1 homolog n=1 Tax=Clonorchis sinensis TaxID=79923 RepID=G7Y435_CLOSI|nr:large subunit GTPase 1 [Clonorchis sinensis]
MCYGNWQLWTCTSGQEEHFHLRYLTEAGTRVAERCATHLHINEVSEGEDLAYNFKQCGHFGNCVLILLRGPVRNKNWAVSTDPDIDTGVYKRIRSFLCSFSHYSSSLTVVHECLGSTKPNAYHGSGVGMFGGNAPATFKSILVIGLHFTNYDPSGELFVASHALAYGIDTATSHTVFKLSSSQSSSQIEFEPGEIERFESRDPVPLLQSQAEGCTVQFSFSAHNPCTDVQWFQLLQLRAAGIDDKWICLLSTSGSRGYIVKVIALMQERHSRPKAVTVVAVGLQYCTDPSGYTDWNEDSTMLGRPTDRHTTCTNEDFSRLPVRSITEENSLSEFFNIAELANSDFTAQKKSFRLLSQNDMSGVSSVVSRLKFKELHSSYQNLLKIPRRPKWTRDMPADELVRLEKEELLAWRRSLVKLEETDGIVLTPFEKNIEFWRQLWRVVERSDILVQIVDARQPLLYYCSDLESYAREVDPNKICLVLVNKADFLTPEQRSCWSKYFQSNGIRAIFWSATLAAAAAAHPVTGPDSLAKRQFDGDSSADSVLQELQVDDASSDTSESTAKNDSSTEGESDGDPPTSFGPEDASKGNETVHSYDSQAGRKNKVSTSERGLDSGTQSTQLFGTEELLNLLQNDIHPPNAPRLSPSQLTVGFVGYPNVGKSSTLNALMGCKKTAVSATPGRTKHFQTLCVRPGLVLCDCPGLVMPSFVYSKADLVVAGILSIDEMRDCLSPIGLICEQIPRSVLEFKYGINLQKPKLDVQVDSSQPEPPPTPHELLAAHAFSHSFMTAKGNPHYDRSARLILKDYVQGRLLYCHPPPNVDPEQFQLLGRSADGLHPSLAHSHITKSGRPVGSRKPGGVGSQLDPGVITDFDRLAFKTPYCKEKNKGGLSAGLLQSFRVAYTSKRIQAIWIETDNENATDVDQQPYFAASPTRRNGDHELPILEGSTVTEDDEDKLSSFSSSSWSTVNSSVGSSSLLSGAESTAASTVMGSESMKKPWRIVSRGMFAVIRKSRLPHLRSYGVFSLLSTHPLENTQQQPSIDASAEHYAALKPEGSALLGESPHFSPVSHPDPLFNWDDIRHSVQARGLLEHFNLDHLVKLHTEMDGLNCQIRDLEGQRRQNHLRESTLTGGLHDVQNELEEIPLESRCPYASYIRWTQSNQRTEPTVSKLTTAPIRLTSSSGEPVNNCRFGMLKTIGTRAMLRETLGWLLVCSPTGSEPKLVRTFKPRTVGRTMSWSEVKNDLHVTPLGTYLTGHLAHVDTSHLNSIRDRWLDPGSHPAVPSYPIHLSDFARGPAVEGCGSSVIDQAIRLLPSPGDLLKQTNQDSSGNVTSDWLLNPYTTCYLVGSASLPAFAAYFLRQQVRPETPLPLRIVSLGSVYERTMSGNEVTFDQEHKTTNASIFGGLVIRSPVHCFRFRYRFSTNPHYVNNMDFHSVTMIVYCAASRSSHVDNIWIHRLFSPHAAWQVLSAGPADGAAAGNVDRYITRSNICVGNKSDGDLEDQTYHIGVKEGETGGGLCRVFINLLSILEISSNWQACTEGFDRIMDDLCQFWSRYQPSWPLRLIYIPAFQLAEYEMLRAVVEVVPDITDVSHSSPIQLASVSVLGDWVSRRVTTKVPHRTNQEGESDAYLPQKELTDNGTQQLYSKEASASECKSYKGPALFKGYFLTLIRAVWNLTFLTDSFDCDSMTTFAKYAQYESEHFNLGVSGTSQSQGYRMVLLGAKGRLSYSNCSCFDCCNDFPAVATTILPSIIHPYHSSWHPNRHCQNPSTHLYMHIVVSKPVTGYLLSWQSGEKLMTIAQNRALPPAKNSGVMLSSSQKEIRDDSTQTFSDHFHTPLPGLIKLSVVYTYGVVLALAECEDMVNANPTSSQVHLSGARSHKDCNEVLKFDRLPDIISISDKSRKPSDLREWGVISVCIWKVSSDSNSHLQHTEPLGDKWLIGSGINSH